MLKNEILSIEPTKSLKGELIKLVFDLKINKISETLINDDEFIYDDEILLINFGEVEKFTSDYIYQSKLTVFKDDNYINFGGYTPDFRRKGDMISDKTGNIRFDPYKKYHVEITLSKYRVYININNGEIVDTYGNGRIEITDVKFYLRKGCDVSIYNYNLCEIKPPKYVLDPILKDFIDKGIATNYLYYHVDNFGVYFDRMNIIQNIKCRTRNSGQYNSNVIFDLYTNSKKIGIEYTVIDSEIKNYEFEFGFMINRTKVPVKIKKVSKGDSFYEEFIVNNDNEYNRLTLLFPTSFTVAIKKVVLDDNAVYASVKKEKTIFFFGDSITEGSECFDPSSTYFSKVALTYNLKSINQAISGVTFDDYNVLGDYPIIPDYVMVAYGTNSFCMGTDDKEKILNQMEKDMIVVINAIKNSFPSAKIIALLPIWRSDENGPKYSLKDTAERMKEVYSRYKEISVIDCYNYIPFDSKYFSNSELALHPQSCGHRLYGEALLKDLVNVIGEPPIIDDIKNAYEAFKK